MSVLANMEASTGLVTAPRIESTAQPSAVPVLVNRQGVPLTQEQITALDEEMRREPEHPDTTCSPGWCLVRPAIVDGRVSHWDGYHRAEVRTVFVVWGLTIQVGLGQSAEGSEPVVHLRALENDCNGEEPYDVVMSPDEALAMATHLREAAVQVRREITQWHAQGGGAR
jgi:hypothetical protein